METLVVNESYCQFYKPVEDCDAKTLQIFPLASVMQICNLGFLEIQCPFHVKYIDFKQKVLFAL
jgi:hypothetical protein